MFEALFKALPRSTLLQSAAYGRALESLGEGRPRLALITLDGRQAGLVQLIETRRLGGLIHTIALDRGPLWFEGFGEAGHIAAFFAEFNRLFRPRPGRRRRVIPEAANDHENILRAAGLRRKESFPAYQTCTIDLARDFESLRAGLRKNWRGSLTKSESAGLACAWDESEDALPLFLKHYQVDKAKKGYPGPSVRLLDALGRECAKEKNLLIGSTKFAQNTVSAVLILCHGNSATYQAGWTSDHGRNLAAHHLLLWDALRVLKERHIRDFDLGGVNDDGASGIKTFKEGLGGQAVRLAGFYR